MIVEMFKGIPDELQTGSSVALNDWYFEDSTKGKIVRTTDAFVVCFPTEKKFDI